ncbi:MAG: hypothetical protein MSH66_05850 [Bacteroidales bacterium]|nr:hypothetical protein [Bacteroidales bacterium]
MIGRKTLAAAARGGRRGAVFPAGRRRFKAAIFYFLGDVFHYLLDNFPAPIRKFLLQSL